MKKRVVWLGLSILLLLFAFSCDPEPTPEFVEIIFEIPLSITPTKDTVSIGDTLWLEANFPDTVKDHKSGNYYHVPPSFDFRTSLGIRELVSPDRDITQQLGVASTFTIINQQGAIKNIGQTYGDLMLTHVNNHYVARIGLISTQTGIISISFFNTWITGGVYEDDADLSFINLGKSGKASRKAVLKNIYYVVNEGDTAKNNFDLFQKHCKAGSLTNPVEPLVYFEQKGTFTFVVTD